jgi:hypothetical protein
MKYDALGNRIVKENPKHKVKEVYVRDAQGNILALYQVKNDSLYTKEFYMYGSNRLGYIEDEVFLGKKCMGKFCNITANPINPMPFIGTQKTLPTLPPVVIQSMVSSSVGIVFGKKRYELTDWLGNVRVVINDRKTPVNIGTTTVGYKAQVVSITDYYSFGSEIAERSYDPVKPFYRFGFNTQEKTFELNRDHYTAKFWEYDARLGRRWNVDPKPNAALSNYAVLNGNPILLTDIDGDTTYIFTNKGVFKGVILDNLSSNEIVLMSEKNANAVFTLVGKYSNEIVAKVARDPKFAYARITANTAEELMKHWTPSKQENAGLLYADKNTKEVKVAKAHQEEINLAILGGEADARSLAGLENEVKDKGIIVGIWHTHPENTFEASQPSTRDYEGAGYVNSLQKGGIGIIVQKEKFSIYTLNDFYNPEWLGTVGKTEKKDLRVFPSDHHKSVFNKNISPQYINKK